MMTIKWGLIILSYIFLHQLLRYIECGCGLEWNV